MRIRWLAGLAFLLLTGPTAAVADAITEDDVKLALSYKVARFVTWPEGDERTDFNICIAGDRSFETAKARLTGRAIRDREISLSKISVNSDLSACHAIYIAQEEAKRAEQYLSALNTQPVLVISDVADFAENGGMVGLSLRNKRVGLTINVAAYEQAGLEFSSQLLELATLVEPVTGDAE